MKLYEAYSTVDQYRGCKDVQFHWFVSERQEPVVTPEEAITDYAKLEESIQAYAFGYVDELLTEKETFELRRYLRERRGIGIDVIEVELPILGAWKTGGVESSIMGIGALPVGGLTGFYDLSKEQGYDLDVPICGYFDLRRCDSINPTTGDIVVGHDDEGETAIVITLRPGDDFSWEHPLTLISHVSQMLEGIALSQLGEELPF